MLSLTSSVRYYLYLGATDMRKSFDGLYGLVVNQLNRDPFSGEAFIFINKRMNMMKVLHWEAGGFVLYYKRLEQGTFEIPAYNVEKRGYRMDWSQFVMMVDGIEWKKVKKRKRFPQKMAV